MDEEWNWEVEVNKNTAWRDQLMAELNDHPIDFIQIIDSYLQEIDYWRILVRIKKKLTFG